jgi:hypothetical protein
MEMGGRDPMMRPAVLLLGLVAATPVLAQQAAAPRAGERAATRSAAPADARTMAPHDLTGYWVSIITEDWRFRMLTPDKGDFPGVPLNPAGIALANRWDPAQDEASGEQCKSYGAAAIMRVPTRLHISWVDANTLRIDTDAGKQTRMLHFVSSPAGEPAPDWASTSLASHIPPASPSWQGYSVADWEGLRQGAGLITVVRGVGSSQAHEPQGYLRVITTHLRPGYLRKNGVPYGPETSVEEYFDGFKEANGDQWLVVTTIVSDPEYLTQPFVTSSQFKKERDGSRWRPTPCEAR